MIPNTPPDNNPTLTGAASPEEREAAQAANEADAQSELPAELDALKVKTSNSLTTTCVPRPRLKMRVAAPMTRSPKPENSQLKALRKACCP